MILILALLLIVIVVGIGAAVKLLWLGLLAGVVIGIALWVARGISGRP